MNFYNEDLFEFLQERVLEGTSDDREVAQYEFLNENFIEQGNYTFGDINPKDDNDEPTQYNGKAKESEPFPGNSEGVVMFDTPKPREKKMYLRKKDRKAKVLGKIKVFSKFTLLNTSQGEIWVPNQIANAKEIIIDEEDMDLRTYSKKELKPKKKKKVRKVNVDFFKTTKNAVKAAQGEE